MSDTVIMVAGTTSGATGIDLERKRVTEQEWLNFLVKSVTNNENNARRLKTIQNNLHILALDVDTTNVYQLNAPLDDVVPTWPIGTFIACPIPGPNMVKRIKEGYHRGYENLNPSAIEALQNAQNASGGTRPNGWLAGEVNRDTIEGAIRQKFKSIIERRATLAQSNNHIRFILVRTSLGGFSSGAADLILQIARKVAEEMGLLISIMSFLLVPGTNASKDKMNSLAVTYGLMKELVARSIGYRYQREIPRGGQTPEMVPSVFHQTIVLSDTNNAPGKPTSLSIENFNGMASELLRAIVFTKLGSRIEAAAGDMDIRSKELSVTGEPLTCRSAGISIIYLDRELGLRYAEAKLKHRFFEGQLQEIHLATITTEVRTFFERHHLLEGKGAQELSNQLLESTNVDDTLSLNRFTQLYHQATANLEGIKLLTGARNILDFAIRNNGDLDESLNRRCDLLLQSLQTRLRERTNQLAQDQHTSLMAGRQLLEQAITLSEHIATEATNDNAGFEERIAELENHINEIEQNYIPNILRRNFIYKFVRRNRIKAAARAYGRYLEQYQAAVIQQQAHFSAIEVLNRLTEILKHHLSEIQVALDVVTSESGKAEFELTKVRDHRSDFKCPVGLPLLNSVDDLEGFYKEVLPEGGEEKALADIYTRLNSVENIVDMLGDTERLHQELGQVIERTFLEKVENLHVVDYLRHRYPQPEQLGAVLCERDKESFEYLQLKDSSRHENGLHLLRLFGVDNARMGNLKELLARYSDARTTTYETMDIDDPERIIFLQIRAAFPYSDWSHFDVAGRIYDQLSKQIQFEKYHVVAGDRSLPTPGNFLTQFEAQAVVVRAWLLNRLEHDSSQGWLLKSVDNGAMPLGLGKNVEVLMGREGYKHAVDVISHYICEYFAKGPYPIQKQLLHLFDIKTKKTKAANNTERELALMITETLRDVLEQELQWWQKNTIPGAMEWFKAKAQKTQAN